MNTRLLQAAANHIENLSEWVGRSIAWLTIFMAATTFSIVVLRYVFDTGWIWLQESVTFMHALVFMIGASYTLKHNGHVRVDIFYRGMSLRKKALVDLLGSLLLLLPMFIFIVWTSWEYVVVSWGLHEGSREAGGLPGVFLLKTAIVIMAFLMLLQGLAMAINSLLILLNVDISPEPPRICGREPDAPWNEVSPPPPE